MKEVTVVIGRHSRGGPAIKGTEVPAMRDETSDNRRDGPIDKVPRGFLSTHNVLIRIAPSFSKRERSSNERKGTNHTPTILLIFSTSGSRTKAIRIAVVAHREA